VIRREREECGCGLTDFARLVGISPSWLSRIENNKARPSPDVLRRIALVVAERASVRIAMSAVATHENEGSDDSPSQ
jgi:transcriptional regulator with XRE-family HTH domain